ncbi:Cof-type HAD-IIB family hydrolase [Apilactobacillus xinyiensis]|uniref:Cof-type HAD-IIB family hydrolase n=1 Tax=Apilactobacillus xinyiensis TaxID=2841032 RepID=UPI002034E283|nr:Cof-type HAD-IIB family hydrolase [Apilactobacillus xinyiensis]
MFLVSMLTLYCDFKGDKNIENQKLIAIDLDGTTLNSNSKLTDRTINTINKLNQTQHIVTIVTGRPTRLVTDIYRQLNLDTPMINFNGSLGFNPIQKWQYEYKYSIKRDIALHFANNSEKLGINLITAEDKELFLANRPAKDEALGFFPTKLKSENILSESSLKVDPICLTLEVKPEKEQDFIKYVKDNFEEELQISPWGGPNSIIEIASGGVNKVTGIKRLADFYNIKQEDIIAFGDEFNDKSMLEYAGFGVAMKNGQPKVKAIADDITELDNDHDGLADYIEKHFKI